MDCAGNPVSIGTKILAEAGATGTVGPGANGVSSGLKELSDRVAPGPCTGSVVNIPFEGSPVRKL
jgi:hypothetical protein